MTQTLKAQFRQGPSMDRGEAAIQANLSAERARVQKAENLNERVSYDMDERLARLQADTMIKPPQRLAKVAGEVANLDDLGCITSWLVATLENPNSISVDASERRLYLAAGAGVLQSAVDAANSGCAENSLEKMLCHQLAAAHSAAMKLVGRVGGGGMPIVEESRLANAAGRMMQIFQEGMLTLQKLKTGGKQTMIVQHVQVSDGGNALVAASVNGSSPSRKAFGGM
jgi:hypothetical protein